MDTIICVLDASGSMAAVRDDALGGLREFVRKNLEHGDAHLLVAFFNNEWEVKHEGKLSDFKAPESWPCDGCTALYDGIGKTISYADASFSHGGKTILAILTDGMENYSREHSRHSINELITGKRENGWEVTFLAANQDAWQTASKLGIDRGSTFSYESSDTKKGFSRYTSSVINSRTS